MEIFTIRSTLTNTITLQPMTEAQMHTSCPKMCHLNKTRITLRWDIWRFVAQMHKYSVIAYIWLQFTMQTLSKMNIFTICSILTNSITLQPITEAQMHSSCPKIYVYHLDKTRAKSRWDIWQCAAHNVQVFSYCLHMGPIHDGNTFNKHFQVI